MTHPEIAAPQAGADRFSVLSLTTPVAMGYIPLGTVFGFLFVQAGAEWWLAVLSSIVVFAGAAQLVAIGMLKGGAKTEAQRKAALSFLKFLWDNNYEWSRTGHLTVSKTVAASQKFTSLPFRKNIAEITSTGYSLPNSVVRQRAIVAEIRLPRVLLAILVGMSLGMSGAALQGLLRNPLAEPGLLGVSSSASLGAVLCL